MDAHELQSFARSAFRQTEQISPPTATGAPSVVLLGSGVASLRPNCSVMMCGLRPGGGVDDANAEADFARKLYEPNSRLSSVLDIAWHGGSRGSSSHQIAIQAVLAFLNGCPIEEIEPWLAGDRRPPEERLRPGDLDFVRDTPQIHLSPFRSKMIEDGLAAPEMYEHMGRWIIENARPRVLVSDGNGAGSAFADIASNHPIGEIVIEEAIPRSFNVKKTTITSGTLSGMLMVGLPTLSRAKKTNVIHILEVLERWGLRGIASSA